MTLACPACGKKYTAHRGTTPQDEAETRDACDRCGCDLSSLQATLRAAAAQLRLAKTALEEHDWGGSLLYAAQSWDLVHSVHSARVACLAAAGMGHATALEQWRRRSD